MEPPPRGDRPSRALSIGPGWGSPEPAGAFACPLPTPFGERGGQPPGGALAQAAQSQVASMRPMEADRGLDPVVDPRASPLGGERPVAQRSHGPHAPWQRPRHEERRGRRGIACPARSSAQRATSDQLQRHSSSPGAAHAATPSRSPGAGPTLDRHRALRCFGAGGLVAETADQRQRYGASLRGSSSGSLSRRVRRERQQA